MDILFNDCKSYNTLNDGLYERLKFEIEQHINSKIKKNEFCSKQKEIKISPEFKRLVKSYFTKTKIKSVDKIYHVANKEFPTDEVLGKQYIQLILDEDKYFYNQYITNKKHLEELNKNCDVPISVVNYLTKILLLSMSFHTRYKDFGKGLDVDKVVQTLYTEYHDKYILKDSDREKSNKESVMNAEIKTLSESNIKELLKDLV